MSSLFTKIIAWEIPSDILYQDDSFIVIRDIKPETNTHLLIIPKKEIQTINDIDADDKALMSDMIFLAKKIAKDFWVEKSYQLRLNVWEMQEIMHIHMHLLSDL